MPDPDPPSDESSARRRPPGDAGTAARACQDPAAGGETPGEHRREAGTDVADPVRRSARTFGTGHPRLEAGPVTLRRPEERDAAAIAGCHNDPEIARWFGVAHPWTHDDALRYVTVEVPAWWSRGEEAVFAVVGADDAYQGSVDLRVRGTDPAAGEVGFFVAPAARGRGYATAALTAVCRWGFEALGLERVEWRAEVGNDASRRVAQKAGFTMEGLLRRALVTGGTRRDCWIGSLLREDMA
ncbi:GNAT family N-acetyltransferase [Actinoplanes sp. NPDC049316]|uniref:GNAT family N-acetyltransferase n=1 Tax=Actinoplanes sp. NPDC049316 TaxID=3154727 RepID=UPI00341EE071